MHKLPQNTERLRFREWKETDFELAMRLWGDGRVTRLIDRRERLDETAVRERLAKESTNWTTRGYCYYQLHSTSEPSEFVGVCGLQPRIPSMPEIPNALCFEVGAHLRPEFWKSGFAIEATKAVARHAFVELGATELFARHHPQNEGSRKVLTRLGFIHFADELFPPTGLIHIGYRLTRPDWEKQ